MDSPIQLARSAARVAFANQLLLSASLVALVPWSVSAQQPARRSHKRVPPPVIEMPVQPPTQAFPLVQPPVLTPEELPPMAPQVIWDGTQLTISTNNSTLGAVLQAVRDKTGAYIDVPAGVSTNRIAAQIGPGPARDVLSTLLAGTEFDYVIQASDDDPLGVQSIFLTQRGKPGKEAAGTNSAVAGSRRERYQRFIGARFPDQSTGQAPAETASPEGSLADAIDSKNGTESRPPAVDVNGSTSEAQPSNPSQPAVADAKPATADTSTASTTTTPSSSDAAAVVNDESSPARPSETAQANPLQQKVADMESLFEQRKQMQQQALKPKDSN